MLSFRSRVALTTFCVAALAILGLTVATLWIGGAQHEQLQSQVDEAAFALLAELARADLPANRLQILTSATARLAASPTVEIAIVTDPRRRVIASSDPSRLATQFEESPGWRLVAVFSPQGQAATVGMLRSPRLWHQLMAPRLGAIAIMSLLAVALISIPLSSWLTKRLGELRQAAKKAVQSSPSQEDEISAIGHALDELSRTQAAGTISIESRERQLQALMDELPVGICYTTSDLRMTFLNRRLAGWMRSERQIVAGRYLAEILPPEEFEESLRGLTPALRGEQVLREREYTIDGQHALVEMMNIPDLDDQGSVRGILTICRNITDQRAEEQQLQKTLDRLTAKNAELESVSYTVSHDLKGPLTTILGCADLIELSLGIADSSESAFQDQVHEDLQQIRHAAGTMRKMLDEVLELARVGLVANQDSRINLRQLAEDIVRLLAGRIGSAGTEIHIDSELPTVIGDRQRLQRVLLNLIDNAVKFSADEELPRVEIGQRIEDGETVVFVRDNGTGIPLEQQAQVFDLFRKLDPESDGTGIGLAIVRRIVNVHGGRIWVESAGTGQGTTFCFILPEAENSTTNDAQSNQSSSSYPKLQSSGALPHVSGG